MIIDISDSGFKRIFNEKQFELPIRWCGGDYAQFLKNLYNQYIMHLCKNSQDYGCRLLACCDDEMRYLKDFNCRMTEDCNIPHIKYICDKIVETVKKYNNGLPASAYKAFDNVMKKLIKKPIKIYPKSGWTEAFQFCDPLSLFRVVNVNEDTVFPRSRVFHTPYNLRSKVSTSRYSIAGYPSLYLGTHVELCLNELRNNSQTQLRLCSRFQLDRNIHHNDYEINVIELAIKPQDFFKNSGENNVNSDNRYIRGSLLQDNEVRESYLMWYPLIAACSFIRACKSDPFAPEYVIPQLLMQWLRNWNENNHKLFGLRYFSCASERASDEGFNYVFPTSGEEHRDIKNYCAVLVDSFKTSLPTFIHEYNSAAECEDYLNRLSDEDMDYIYK